MALVAAAVAGFAKQLGDALRRARERRASPTADVIAPEPPASQESATVELRLRQQDGTYKVAAHGQVNNAIVKDLIHEIGDDT